MCFVETHKKNYRSANIQNCYNWTSNGQFKSKIDLPFEKVSKITCGALTIEFLFLMVRLYQFGVY